MQTNKTYSSILDLENHLTSRSNNTTSSFKNWIPNENQNRLLSRQEREVLGGGNRGGGKTEGVLAALTRYSDHPNYTALVIRKTAEDLKGWAKRAEKFFAPLGGKVTGQPPKVTFPSTAKIFTGHLSNPDSYTKYVGQEYWICNIEELTEIPSERTYEQLLGSVRSPEPDVIPQMICTANPGQVGHAWVKKRFVDACKSGYGPDGEPVYETYTDENGSSRIFVPMPLFFNKHIYENDKEYVKFLQSISDPNLKRAWLYGDWDVFMGQFFAAWNPELHVVPHQKIPESWKRYRGIDYANRNPASCIWGAVNPEGQVFIYREFLESGLILSEAANKIKELSKDEKYVSTVADPSMWSAKYAGTGERLEQRTLRSEYDYFKAEGVYMEKANNSRPNGWNNMKELLGNGRTPNKLFIMDNCVNLINHIPYAVYHKIKKGDIDDIVTQSGSEDFYHWDDLDALRYLLMKVMNKAPALQPIPTVQSRMSVKPLMESLFKPSKSTRSWMDSGQKQQF